MITMDELAQIVQQGFQEMHQNFANVNLRIDKLEHRMDNIEQRVGSMENRMDSIEQNMEKMGERLVNIEKDVSYLARGVGEHAVLLNRLVN